MIPAPVQSFAAEGPMTVKLAGKPKVGHCVAYCVLAVFNVRTEPTAEDSFAEMRAFSKFGMAIAAMIRMIATTISNSISENPFCFFIRAPWMSYLSERAGKPGWERLWKPIESHVIGKQRFHTAREEYSQVRDQIDVLTR